MTNNTQLLPCPFCGEPLAVNNANLGVHPRFSECLFAQHVVVVDDTAQVRKWNTRAPAEDVRAVVEEQTLRDAIAFAIGGDAYDCTRVWHAWGAGTMSQDDFVPIVGQDERLTEIVAACRANQTAPESCDGITWKATGDANFYRLMKDGDWFAVMQFNGQPPVAAHEAFLNSLFGSEEGGR